MGRLDSPMLEELVGIKLSDAEIALLLSLPAIRTEIASLLSEARWDTAPEGVELTALDLGELAGCVAFEARNTENRDLKECLQRLFDHLLDAMRAETARRRRHPATARELAARRHRDSSVPVLRPLQFSLRFA